MMNRNMQRDYRLLLMRELCAFVLFALAPLTFGCVKLKTLECESSPEGCRDRQSDTRRTDETPTNPDAYVEESPDTAQAEPTVRLDASADSAHEGENPTDAGVTSEDGRPSDTAKDNPADAAQPDVPAKEGGILSETGRSDTVDAVADTARTPDTRTPDLALMPDVSAQYTVTFNAGVAKGAMSGYGWVTMGALDIVSSPTCGASNEPITSANTCVSTSTNWDSSNALCVSGTIPALPPTPTGTDYSDNWGIQLGANASDPIGALGKSYSTITLNFTGEPKTGLRATVHRTGDPVGTTYCSLVTSGTPMALTSFNTSCWNNSGTSLTAADLPKIDKVGLEIPSTQEEITVSKLCLTGIVLGI